jgi:gliding motility-associated-like protein
MHFKITIFFALLTLKLTAQTLQLPLDQDRFTSTSSIMEAGKDSFIYSSTVIPPNFFGSVTTNNLTQISLSKGVLWSFDFMYPKITNSSQLTNYKDGFLWSGFAFDANKNKHLMRLDKQGNVLWSKIYGNTNDVDTVNGGKSQAIELPDGNIAFAGGAARFARTVKPNDLFLAKLDPNGNQIWAKNYLFSNLSNTYTNFSSLIQTTDGGYLICGSIYTLLDRSILLLKTDANGTLQWTRAYSNPGTSFVSDELGVQALQAPNNKYILVANQNDLNANSGQIIAQIETNGAVSNSFIVRAKPGLNYTLQANKAFFDASNNALVVGASILQDSTPTVSVEQNLLYKIRLTGNFDWKYNYYNEIAVGFLTQNSDLVQTKNGGFAHLTAFSENFDNLYPILIVSDNKGETGCQLPIDLVVQRSFPLTLKDFTIQERSVTSALDYPVTKMPFNFSPKFPTLNLGSDTAVCNADTSFVLNALDPDFNTYKWSTGETMPKITVNQLGKYVVTVTSTKFCLTLNDTIAISKSVQCETESELDIPNAFTPNNDNINDSFGPFGTGFTVQSFQIYNRWGNLVFEGSDTNRTWNGQIDGKDAASDIYVYAIKYKLKGKETLQGGEVNLIR